MSIPNLCDKKGCCTETWPGECAEIIKRYPETLIDKCKGPIQVGIPDLPNFIGFIYWNTCTCTAPPYDVCWGCYLESK